MAAGGLVAATCVLLFAATHAKIGYFWHITDFHYDPQYTPQGDNRRQCRKVDDRGSSGHHRALGRFGDYACDSPRELIESAARYMRTRHADNVEFVLWTGDILASQFTGTEEERYQAIRNMTDLLRGTFSSHFVFPVLGHLDPAPSERLTNLWMNWLPNEALQTFSNGGYYTIEQTASKLRIVALNTNLFSAREANNVNARRQWDWLNSTLEKATANGEMVYIVGHAAPGGSWAAAGEAYSAEAAARFLRTVTQYAHVIAGQFFGHLHADSFRVFYDHERPVSWALLSPAVSPRRAAAAANPAIRLYKFDINTGKVLDYTQYYLDLAAANRLGAAVWAPEYNLTAHYQLADVSPLALHGLAERLRPGVPPDTATFNKYLRAYTVRYENSEPCEGTCALRHYCAVRCAERGERSRCLAAAASALAAAAAHAPLLAPSLSVFATLLVVVFIAFVNVKSVLKV